MSTKPRTKKSAVAETPVPSKKIDKRTMAKMQQEIAALFTKHSVNLTPNNLLSVVYSTD